MQDKSRLCQTREYGPYLYIEARTGLCICKISQEFVCYGLNATNMESD